MISDPFAPHALAVIFVMGAAALACVQRLHYEGFSALARRARDLHLRVPKRLIDLLLPALMTLRIAGIRLFAASHFPIAAGNDLESTVRGALELPNFVYFPATVDTIHGFGDLNAQAAIRFLTGTEAAAGFL